VAGRSTRSLAVLWPRRKRLSKKFIKPKSTRPSDASTHEAIGRFNAAIGFLASFDHSGRIPELEAAVLQVRKALESIAMAAIAPNKDKYEAFRALATNAPDFTKDYHAARIFQALEKINPNFYPTALLPSVRQSDGRHHFPRKELGFLSKKRFASTYDRLGKHLHADNPWGSPKHLANLANEIPKVIDESFGLLELHVAYVRAPRYDGVWIVEANRRGSKPKIIQALASGPYAVKDS
jgi:hypothetical protein